LVLSPFVSIARSFRARLTKPCHRLIDYADLNKIIDFILEKEPARNRKSVVVAAADPHGEFIALPVSTLAFPHPFNCRE
jgi:hypothetical protein